VLVTSGREARLTSRLVYPLRESFTWKVCNCGLLLFGVLYSKRNRYSFTESSAHYPTQHRTTLYGLSCAASFEKYTGM
jgi:hypothetical protein